MAIRSDQDGRRRRAIACAIAALALASGESARGDTAEELAARASYSLGHQIGADLARQGREIDVESLRRGLRDALAGSAPALPDAERSELLIGLKRTLVASEREERIRGSSPQRQAGDAFRAANAEKEGVVELASGLQYRVIRAGSGPRAGAGDRVTLRYRSTRVDGTAFHDSMREGAEPETFRVGALVRGLTEAVQLMPEGSRWEIVLPPELAFGRRGPLQDETVVYDLELLSVEPGGTAGGEDGS